MRDALTFPASATVIPPSATPPGLHRRRLNTSPATKPRPKSNPEHRPQLSTFHPFISSSSSQNRRSPTNYTELASKLAEDGRFEDFLKLLESAFASGIEPSDFLAQLDVKSVASGIAGVLGQSNVSSAVEVLLDGVRSLGIEPVQLFDGAAMELLRKECRRLLKCGELEQLVSLVEVLAGFQFQIKELVKPSDVISVCINNRDPTTAIRFAQNFPHAEVLFCSIILQYGKRRDMASALTAFELSKKHTSTPNMHAYRTIIDVCGLCGNYLKSRTIYEKLGVVADITSHNIVLKSCCLARKVELAHDVYRQIRKLEAEGALKLDVFTYSTIIKVFADAKKWKMALEIKEDMASSGVIPNKFTWSSLISACANAGLTEQAIKLFDEMLQTGCQPNSHCFNTVLHACVMSCQFDHAFRLFNSWKEKGFQRITPNDEFNDNSRKTVKTPLGPTISTYNILMKACGTDYHRAKALMDEMKTLGLSPDQISWSILIDICGGSRDVTGAVQTLRSMHESGIQPDVIAYTTTIKICVEHKKPKLAFMLFDEMQKYQIKPNLVTYNTLLRARSKYGSLQEVQQCLAIYQQMRRVGYKPNDYYLKQLIEEWCEGVIHNEHVNKKQFGSRLTDYGRQNLLLEKVAEHLQGTAESLSIDLQGLTKVEARIVVLAVLRMIKERYIEGNSLKDDVIIILGIHEVAAHPTRDENGVGEAVTRLLEHDLGLHVFAVGSSSTHSHSELGKVHERSWSKPGSPIRRPIILQRLKVTRDSLHAWLRKGTRLSAR
ncbi:pentatricopeptide repeat-containing family protein [Striga asiatica]|uniref:Pentatricopeptide repeat-containing family protein n=1 Tax=Striga asiatica TaxID=4170 RepID=A0A5A7P7N6_STRAF|nr:pentatricopeptide repeat-containing family protein [Striga asiatica]